MQVSLRPKINSLLGSLWIKFIKKLHVELKLQFVKLIKKL